MAAGARMRGGRAEGIGFWLVLLTAIVSGISTFVNSYAVAGTSSDAFVTIRNVAVALLIAPFALLAARAARDRPSRADWGRLAVIGLIGGAVPFLLFFRGLQLATAAGGATTASFLYRTLFLWATVLGVVALGERVNWRAALAAGALLAGCYLLLSIRSVVWTDGSLYVLAATGLWAGEYTLSKRTMRDLSSGTVALGRMGFGAVYLVAFLGITGGFATVAGYTSAQWTWVGISGLLLAAFVGTWYAGLARIDVGVATSILVLGYPVTLLVSSLATHTVAPVYPVVGAVLVAIGVVVVSGRQLLEEAGRALRSWLPFGATAP